MNLAGPMLTTDASGLRFRLQGRLCVLTARAVRSSQEPHDWSDSDHTDVVPESPSRCLKSHCHLPPATRHEQWQAHGKATVHEHGGGVHTILNRCSRMMLSGQVYASSGSYFSFMLIN